MADNVGTMEALGRFLAWTLVLGALVIGALRWFVFEPWTIPDDEAIGASVAPTLLAGDTVLLLMPGTPGVGDLVRCKDPRRADGFVVGRIVARGGDRVSIDGDAVTVNGYAFHASERCAEQDVSAVLPGTKRRTTVECHRLEMAGASHLIGRVPGVPAEPAASFDVERGRVVLVSDNRSSPNDSRRFGQVALASCDRRVVLRAWSAKGWSDVARRLTLIR